MTELFPFCNIEPERVLYEDAHCFVIRDGFPVSYGHTLIITRRHVSSFFDTTPEEKTALLNALGSAQKGMAIEYHPDAWNIGINDGPAAGQTVPHLHIHLIPRYDGDVPDPRGGVRRVIPDQAHYLTKLRSLRPDRSSGDPKLHDFRCLTRRVT